MNAKTGSLLAALLIVMACQNPGSPASGNLGSLTITLPAPSGRAVTANGGQGNLVRIQLIRNGAVVQLSGQDFLEQGLAGQTITLDGLTTGTGYTVYASTGQKNTATAGGFYETAYFASSSAFEISAGTSTAVSLTLTATPISIIEDNASSNHAAVVISGSPSLAFVDGTAINKVSAPSNPVSGTRTSYIASYLTNAPGAKVYSFFNTNSYGVWVNTDQGLLVTSGSVLQSAATHPMLASGGGNLNPVPQVYGSGTISLTTGAVMAYYFGPGLMAGFATDSTASGSNFNSGNPKWKTLSEMLSLSSSPALQTALNKLNQAVFGVATDGNNFILLSTGIGTFRLTSGLIAQGTGVVGTALSSGKDTNGNSIMITTSDNALIGPVSAFSDNASTGYAFAGTTRGLYGSAVAVSTGLPSGGGNSLPIISGTEGLNITSLATSDVSGAPAKAYTAAYSANSRELLILRNLSVATRVPALAGLPTGTPQFTWYSFSSGGKTNLYLIIAGNEATVAYLADSW